MSDQYYDREDIVDDTPEVALANLDAASLTTANFVHDAAADLNQTKEMLEQIWEHVADPGARAKLEALWAISQRYATRLAQLDANGQLAKTAIEKIEERRKQLQHEQNEINDALDYAASNGYSLHPRLVEVTNALSTTILDGLEEQVDAEGGFFLDDPEAIAFEIGWWDCIQEGAIEDLLNVLFKPHWANRVPTELRDSLSRAINTFSDELTEHIEETRVQTEAILMEEDELEDIDG